MQLLSFVEWERANKKRLELLSDQEVGALVNHAKMKCYSLHKVHFPTQYELNMHHCIGRVYHLPLRVQKGCIFSVISTTFSPSLAHFYLLLIPMLCSDNRLWRFAVRYLSCHSRLLFHLVFHSCVHTVFLLTIFTRPRLPTLVCSSSLLHTPAFMKHVTFVPSAGLRFFLTSHQPYCISVIKYANFKDCMPGRD